GALRDTGIRSAKLIRSGAEPGDVLDRPVGSLANDRIVGAPGMRERMPDHRAALRLATIAAGAAGGEEVKELLRITCKKGVVAYEQEVLCMLLLRLLGVARNWQLLSRNVEELDRQAPEIFLPVLGHHVCGVGKTHPRLVGTTPVDLAFEHADIQAWIAGDGRVDGEIRLHAGVGFRVRVAMEEQRLILVLDDVGQHGGDFADGLVFVLRPRVRLEIKPRRSDNQNEQKEQGKKYSTDNFQKLFRHALSFAWRRFSRQRQDHVGIAVVVRFAIAFLEMADLGFVQPTRSAHVPCYFSGEKVFKNSISAHLSSSLSPGSSLSLK